MTNTTQTDLLDGVEPDAYIDWEFNEATVNRIDDQYQPYYSRKTLEPVIEALLEANRKQVLLETAKEFDTIQGQEIHDTMTYRQCATKLRRMAEGKE